MDPKNNRYDRYGGRGIKVCERWLDFESFLADMGKRPSLDHTIDRIDPNADYKPDNCRWLVRELQSGTRATNQWITYQGETLTASAWGRRIGVRGHTITRRIQAGWSIKDALTKRPGWRRPGLVPGNSRYLTYRGETKTIAAWAAQTGLDRVALWQRIERYGWPVERALTTPGRRWGPGRPKSRKRTLP